MKITHVKLSQIQTPNSRGKRLVTICATLDKPDEFMTITVSVQNGPDQLRVRETGVARAKDFAQQIRGPVSELLPDTGPRDFAGGRADRPPLPVRHVIDPAWQFAAGRFRSRI